MTRVLYIEDNDDNAYMLTRRLTKRGFEVVLAVTGELGLEVARSEPVDIVIVDLLLPRMDGWEVAKTLKADEKTARLPILALSSSAMEVDKKRAIESGCDAFMAKPIDLPQLLATITALINGGDCK